MEALRSPLQSFRPSSSVSTKKSDYLTTNAIDQIYLNETSRSPPLAKVVTKDLSEMRCFTASRPRKYHSRGNSSDYRINSKIPSKTNSILNIEEYLSFTKSPNTQIYQRKPERSYTRVNKIREIRCEAINNLIHACKNIENSKDLSSTIEKEKKVMNEWSKAVDSVTEDILKIKECDPEIIRHLYYYHKESNNSICKDILKIKSRKVKSSLFSVRMDRNLGKKQH